MKGEDVSRIERREFLKAGVLAVGLASAACRESKKGPENQDRGSRLIAPARTNPPIYLSDLDKCLPQSAVGREGKLFCWRIIDYETEHFDGVMLRAGPESDAAEVTYPLNARGWHDIYVGMFNTGWRPYQEQRLWVRLTDDRAYSLLALRAPSIDKGQVIQDVFWETAELSNQDILFKQLCTELVPRGQSSRSSCDTVWIGYIKLVPLSEEEVRTLQADRKRRDTKRLFATQDWGTGMVANATAGNVRDLLESYRHTDFVRIYWEGAAGDLCSYFTKVGRMWTPDHIDIDDFPVFEYRRVVENWTEYVEKGIDPFRVAVDFSHEMGLEFHASYRFCEGMGPFHFSPPFDEVNKGGFYAEHPELRAVRRDGSQAPRISLTFPETRHFLLSLFLEMAEYPIDGICILYNRRPPFVEYEAPLVEGFKREFGEDPRELDERDPRWLQYRCSVLTQLMRDLRERLDALGQRQGRSKRLNLGVWVFGSEKENLFYGMDVRTWIEEGLIDTVIPYTSAEALFSWEPAWENPQDIDYWQSLIRGTSCQLALNFMPRDLSPEEYRRKAHFLYRSGVEYLAFWDSAKVWSVGKGGGASFSDLRRLGHKQELAAWAEAGEPNLHPPSTQLRKVGDWEMTFIAE